MEPADLRRTEGYFEAANGRKLFFRSWQPEPPERAIVLVHGFGEHSGRYESFASWFARKGFAVYALDLQGHGNSPGKRGHVARFGDFLDDVASLNDRVRKEHPGLLRVMIGHSMGGLIVTALASERELHADLLVVSGPALSLSPDISRLKLRLARALRFLIPRLTMKAGLDANGLSRDVKVVRDYLEDPLVHDQMTAAMGAEFSDSILRMEGAPRRIGVPMLLLHGEADPLCRVEGSREFYENLPVEGQPGSEILIYPDFLHEIFNEIGRESVYADLLDWVLRVESQ